MIQSSTIKRHCPVVNKEVLSKEHIAPFIQVSTEFECIVRSSGGLIATSGEVEELNDDTHRDGMHSIPGMYSAEISSKPVAGTYQETVAHFKKCTDFLLRRHDARGGDSNHIHIVINPYYDDYNFAFALPSNAIFRNMASLILRNYAILRYLSGSWGEQVFRRNSYSLFMPPRIERGREVYPEDCDLLWSWNRTQEPEFDRSSILRNKRIYRDICHMEYRACDGNLSPSYLATIACTLKALALKAMDMYSYGVQIEEYREQNIRNLDMLVKHGNLVDKSLFEEPLNTLIDDIEPYLHLIKAHEVIGNLQKLLYRPAWEIRTEHDFDGQEWIYELEGYLSGRKRSHNIPLYDLYVRTLVSNSVPRKPTLGEFEEELARVMGVEVSKVRSIRVRLGNNSVKWSGNRLMWIG